MTTHFKPPAHSSDKCDVCSENIPFFEAVNNKERALNICGSIECTNVLKQKQHMTDAAFNIYLKSHQNVIDQRKQRIKVKQQLKDKEYAVNKLIFKSVIGNYSDQENKPKHLVILPTGRSRMEPLSLTRIDKYVAHLKEVIRQAESYECVEEVPSDNNHEAHIKLIAKEKRFSEHPKLKQISDQFCMMCKGGCCARGEDHAYISASSIRRILDENPAFTGEYLLSEYISHLGNKSMANACINQTNTGCALPRELRSSTCNQFHCSSISKYHEKINSDDDVAPVVVIQRKHTLWDRSYSSEPNSVTEVAIVSSNQCTTLENEWTE